MDYCVEQLSSAYRQTYSNMGQELGNVITWSSHLALEIIANSDALYHNVEHTVMVALAGQSILEGKHLSEGGVSPSDWAHFMIALLCHDIGYVKGICTDDSDSVIASGIDGQKVAIMPGGTDAALLPYHVDRSKMFVRERFGKGMLTEGLIDAERLTSYIEMTRFPVPDGKMYKDTKGYHGLIRAADLIGQLGDPYRIQKCTALFYEFEELGLNKQFGYKTPGDLRENHAKFYWNHVNRYIQEAIRYLRVTQDGKQWIANLQANVFGSCEMAE
ncbi:MAG: hypothetical protein WBM78_11610 [Desulfobacterales bacterium]